MEGRSNLLLQIFIFCLFYILSSSMKSSQDIVVEVCNAGHSIDVSWMIVQDIGGLPNCTIDYGEVQNGGNTSHKFYPFLKMEGNVRLPVTGTRNYSVQIRCGESHSKPHMVQLKDRDCEDSPVTTSPGPVVEYKESSTFLGTRDSVLGIVFALLGLLVILVTAFYVIKRFRRRQRLERIRGYLGSIDPWDNIQNRRTDGDNGSERLMESTDSML